MITYDELKAAIAKAHNPDYAKREGHVWQIWEDGELTMQKSGPLLWQRNLHCMMPGIVSCIPKETMPVVETNHGYAFILNRQAGEELRTLMYQYAGQLV